MGAFAQLLSSSDVTLGLYATSWVSLLGFGALAILVACYMINLGYRETKTERLTILLLFLVACAQLGCDLSSAMRSLIQRLNDATVDRVSPKEVPEATVSPLFAMLMIGCSHIFATGRILCFASSARTSSPFVLRTVQATICTAVLICEVMGITSIAIYLSKMIFVSPEQGTAATAIRPTFILSAVYSACCCVIDIFMAALVIWQAREAKSRISTSAYRAIRSLKRITVTSSCITCTGHLLKIACLYVPILTIWSGAVFNAVSKVYSISLLLSVSLPRISGNIQRTRRPTDSDYVESQEVGSSSGYPKRKSTSPGAMSTNFLSRDEELSGGREIEVEGEMGLSEMLDAEEKTRWTPNSPVLSNIRYQGGRLSDRKPSGEMESVREEDHVVPPSRRKGSTTTTLHSSTINQDEGGFDMTYIVSGLEVLGVQKV